LAKAAIIRPVYAQHAGYVNAMQTRDIGLSLIKLKGGRTRSDQPLDYATGFTEFCQIGDYLDSNKPVAIIHAQNESDFEQAAADLQAAISLNETKPTTTAPVIEKITA
ncbi:MAG: thymidine phosphorylase, partial [Alphaproteobacteria bacterium]|nr:thymidine phosphorylase [Alphaproteobacteria bacterium]